MLILDGPLDKKYRCIIKDGESFAIEKTSLNTVDSRSLALNLIDQIIEMDKTNDYYYQNTRIQLGQIPAQGESAVTFYLKKLKELIGEN